MPLPIGLSSNAPPPIMRFVSHAKKYIFWPKKEWECIIENTVQKMRSEMITEMLKGLTHLNPRLTGVSAERHWPGGGRITPPQVNSQTNDRSETGEAALERSRRDGSKALLKFFLKGHVSGQGQVKGKNWAFQHFGSQNRQLDSNRPKLGRNTLKG